MSDKFDERITIRLDSEQYAAFERLLKTRRRKKSDITREALHEYLMENDAVYRDSVLGVSQESAERERIASTSPLGKIEPLPRQPVDPKDITIASDIEEEGADATIEETEETR